jgi:membrane-bound lytic murein transglycosylase B
LANADKERVRTFIVVFLFCFSACFSAAAQGPKADWSYVEKKLSKAGFQRGYIKALKKSYEPKHFETVVKLNLLLFLVKANYHKVQVTAEGEKNVLSFLAKNEKAFAQAEKEFGVPRNVIASLLWIETRHGQNQGMFHVASAYLHLLQSERPIVKTFLQNKAVDFTKNVTKKQRAEIAKRTKIKADWALKELRSLQALYKKNSKLALKLRGSFSGAFGLPQFLPSSYEMYAKSCKAGKVADLYVPADAICSVGSYLKKHGWRATRSKTHMAALMKYNNSRDYAEAILKLAEKTKNKTPKRLPSNT